MPLSFIHRGPCRFEIKARELAAAETGAGVLASACAEMRSASKYRMLVILCVEGRLLCTMDTLLRNTQLKGKWKGRYSGGGTGGGSLLGEYEVCTLLSLYPDC